MATKLGPVWIPLKLKVDEANQQLNQLEKDLKGKGLRRPGFAPVAQAGTNPAMATARGGTGASGGATISQTAQQYFLRQVGGTVIKKIGGGLSGNPLAQLTQTGMGHVQGLMPGMPPALKALGTAAVAYGMASQAVKQLPGAFAFAKTWFGEESSTRTNIPVVDAADEALMVLRRRVQELEIHVTGLLKGMSKSVEHARASMRVTGGRLPEGTDRMAQGLVQLEKQEQMLQAKFDTWKQREAPWATIRVWWDAVKDGMRR